MRETAQFNIQIETSDKVKMFDNFCEWIILINFAVLDVCLNFYNFGKWIY